MPTGLQKMEEKMIKRQKEMKEIVTARQEKMEQKAKALDNRIKEDIRVRNNKVEEKIRMLDNELGNKIMLNKQRTGQAEHASKHYCKVYNGSSKATSFGRKTLWPKYLLRFEAAAKTSDCTPKKKAKR